MNAWHFLQSAQIKAIIQLNSNTLFPMPTPSSSPALPPKAMGHALLAN